MFTVKNLSFHPAAEKCSPEKFYLDDIFTTYVYGCNPIYGRQKEIHTNRKIFGYPNFVAFLKNFQLLRKENYASLYYQLAVAGVIIHLIY